MGTDQIRREINNLDNEIAVLEKKRADLESKEAYRTKKINDVQKSITKHTSASMLASKSKQIQGHQDEIAKLSKEKADITKKIVEKQKKRSGKVAKLQKEEMAERRNEDKEQQAIQHGYERRINELTEQIQAQVVMTSKHRLYSKTDQEEYDVFISYASEDKKGFVDSLYHELDLWGVKVWYDAIRIQWGDSLRSKIDNGLRKSKFGLVILSNDYIRKGWTQYELDGLFQKEMTDGKTILPIWHKITKDEVQEFSHTLAGRKALDTAMLSAEEIAEELIKLLQLVNTEEAMGELGESTDARQNEI